MADRNRVLWIARATGVFLALGVLMGGIAVGCGGEGGEMTILDVQPRAGAAQGDQPVKITGHNFRTDVGYTVYFGSEKASSVTILDPDTLLVTTPQQDDPGTVDITIRADHGPAFKIAQAYTFEEMEGGVVEGLGEGATSTKKGNLEY